MNSTITSFFISTENTHIRLKANIPFNIVLALIFVNLFVCPFQDLRPPQRVVQSLSLLTTTQISKESTATTTTAGNQKKFQTAAAMWWWIAPD